jgi:hypothetical protein
MAQGITAAARTSVLNPLPNAWLGRADAPSTPPQWAGISAFGSTQIRNLLAQIAYDESTWNYSLIGNDNEVGRYQFDSLTLEQYGLLAAGSNQAYGSDSVNYRHCWRQTQIRNANNSYANYLYNVNSLSEFLNSSAAQEHLAYQLLLDLYVNLLSIDAVVEQDSADVVAGMIYVAWELGVGNNVPPTGAGAYAWRYYNIGSGDNYFNSGRYAITVLGQ